MRLLQATEGPGGPGSGAGPAGGGLDARDLTDEDLEALYARPAGRHARAGFVASLDGAVEIDGRSGGLGSVDDHRVFVTLRALCDVVLVGSATAVTENYGPATLSPPRRERRVARDQGAAPPIAVVSSAAALDPESRLFSSPPGAGVPRPLVLCAAVAPPARRVALDKVADVVECGDQRVELGRALDALAERGLTRVLCEGGPTLLSTLIHDDLLDELCLSQALVLAGPARRSLAAGTAFAAAVPLRLGHLLLGDSVLVGRWELDRASTGQTATTGA
jgi:riboflavin biosynthesis pyrimidine reductase